MAVKSFKMGPGLFTLGTGPLAVQSQVRALTVKAAERVERTDAIPVLSGEELEAEESVSFDWSLVGTILQDLDAAGVIDYSWTNKGTEVPFTFVPSTAEGRQVTGFTYPIPLDVGGDVDRTKSPEAGFTWRVKADPILGDTA
jgi:hypothetical protein